MTNYIIIYISILCAVPLVFDVNASQEENCSICPEQNGSSTDTRKDFSVDEAVDEAVDYSSVSFKSKKSRKEYILNQQATFYPFKSTKQIPLNISSYNVYYSLTQKITSTTVLIR